jgi:hypothetical protein
MERGASQHKGAGLVERDQAARPFMSVSFVTVFCFGESRQVIFLYSEHATEYSKNKIWLNVRLSLHGLPYILSTYHYP